MRKGVIVFLLMIILSFNVIAVNNVKVHVGEEDVVYVPASNNFNEYPVSISFITEHDFEEARLDASALVLSQSLAAAQRNVAVNRAYCTGDGPIACKVDGILFGTNQESVNLIFRFSTAEGSIEETATVSFDVDSQGPVVGSLRINDCSENCYVGNENVRAEAVITDVGVGYSSTQVTLQVSGRQSAEPAQSCEDNTCYFNLGGVNCISGSEVRFTMGAGSVIDKLGNTGANTKRIVALCDNELPQLLTQISATTQGPVASFVEGNPILFRVKVKDLTSVNMKVDLREMDGTVYDADCGETNTLGEYLCEVQANSPPGPQTGNAKIIFTDAAGNELIVDKELEILALDLDATPQAFINQVSHRGSVTRMFMEAAALRSGFNPVYPVSFKINPSLRLEEGSIQTSISHIDLVDCSGGIITNDYELGSNIDRNNRIDLHLNTQYTQTPAAINCSMDVYVKSGTTYYNTPARVNLVTSIELKNTGFSTPGERVVEKLDGSREDATKVFGFVEDINNIMPTFRTMCNINDALSKGQQMGAIIAGVGYAVQVVDGGATKKAGQATSGYLLGASKTLGQYGKDKSDIDQVRGEISNPLGRVGGFLAEACPYITCSESMPKSSLTGTDTWGEFAGSLKDQLTAPSPADNFLAAYDQKCIPAMVANLNDYGQIHCGATRCFKTMAANGLDISSCEAIEAEGMCKKIVGSSVEVGGYLLSKQEGVVGNVGSSILAIKNFRERASTIAINAGLGLVEEQLIERVTGNCEALEQESHFSDQKTWSCFIPYAIRLYIQPNEQAQYARETFGDRNSNLCDIARCEGNECIGQIPIIDNYDAYEEIVLSGAPQVSAEDVAKAREPVPAENQNIIYNPMGIIIPEYESPVGEYVKIGTSDGNSYYIRKDTYEVMSEYEGSGGWQNLETLSQVANGNYERGTTTEYVTYDSESGELYNNYGIPVDWTGSAEDWQAYVDAIVDDPESHALPDGEYVTFTNSEAPEVDWFELRFKQNSGNINEAFLTLPDGVDPETLAPGYLVDPEFYGHGEYLVGNGVTYAKGEDGQWKKVYDPNNLGTTYQVYAATGARFANKWIEEAALGDAKKAINDFVEDYDLYTNLENGFCSAAISRSSEADVSVFEPTEKGYKEFMFNAEKQFFEDENIYYYTLIFYASGFSDEDDGYDVEIFLKPDNKRIAKFKIKENEIYSPNSNDPNYRSIRAWNSSVEYDRLCFKFTPRIAGKDAEMCKTLKDNAWSGLGDPYNPGVSIPRGGSGLKGSGSTGGWEV